MLIGILALQGAVEPHAVKLDSLGVKTRPVKKIDDLDGLSGLILPGGESSTMIHLLKLHGLWGNLEDFARRKPVWGLCAGAILLAKKVSSPAQESLGALDISVTRNAYGRQTESFVDSLVPMNPLKNLEPCEGVFIRAPRIEQVGQKVEILYEWSHEPVMVQQGFTLASTFHPELTESNQLHKYFLSLCEETL